MESKIVELRERGRRGVRRASRAALVAVGTGAAVGVVVLGGFLVYRLTRAPTTHERLRRVLPSGVLALPAGLGRARRVAEVRLRRRVPPVRLYVGDRQVGEEPPTTRWERVIVRAARAFGTAAAAALASRIMMGVAEAARERARAESEREPHAG